MKIDKTSKQKIYDLAYAVLSFFDNGIKNPNEWTASNEQFNTIISFGEHTFFFDETYEKKIKELADAASKILKARKYNSKNIKNKCQQIGQEYTSSKIYSDENLKKFSNKLVELIIGQENYNYFRVEPCFIIDLVDQKKITFDRVSLVDLTEIRNVTPIDKIGLKHNFNFVYGNDLQSIHRDQDNNFTLQMTEFIWVVELEAAKENTHEEAIWLIDIAISFMRIATDKWNSRTPSIGDIEHKSYFYPFGTKFGFTLNHQSIEFRKSSRIYSYMIEDDVYKDLCSTKIQTLANMIFSPKDKSLAQHISQGLGWMTRARQSADRAERLLHFFTALESLLSSNDSSVPIVQTISRYVSVILCDDVNERTKIFDMIKKLYGKRSMVVHKGLREVLWEEVNTLQKHVEDVYSVVFDYCNIEMRHDNFLQSLSNASHGGQWEFNVIGEKLSD